MSDELLRQHRRAWCAVLYEYALCERLYAYFMPASDTPGKIRHLRAHNAYLIKYTQAMRCAQALPAFLEGMLLCMN